MLILFKPPLPAPHLLGVGLDLSLWERGGHMQRLTRRKEHMHPQPSPLPKLQDCLGHTEEPGNSVGTESKALRTWQRGTPRGWLSQHGGTCLRS